MRAQEKRRERKGNAIPRPVCGQWAAACYSPDFMCRRVTGIAFLLFLSLLSLIGPPLHSRSFIFLCDEPRMWRSAHGGPMWEKKKKKGQHKSLNSEMEAHECESYQRLHCCASDLWSQVLPFSGTHTRTLPENGRKAEELVSLFFSLCHAGRTIKRQGTIGPALDKEIKEKWERSVLAISIQCMARESIQFVWMCGSIQRWRSSHILWTHSWFCDQRPMNGCPTICELTSRYPLIRRGLAASQRYLSGHRFWASSIDHWSQCHRWPWILW